MDVTITESNDKTILTGPSDNRFMLTVVQLGTYNTDAGARFAEHLLEQ